MKFSRVVECLATVDVLDLFFDVKLVYNLVVDAMETFGRRNEVVWDTLLMAELRRRAHFRASAAIPRDALNAMLEPLTAMQAEQNEFERLTTNLGGASIHAAPVRAQAVLVSHGETDSAGAEVQVPGGRVQSLCVRGEATECRTSARRG